MNLVKMRSLTLFCALAQLIAACHVNSGKSIATTYVAAATAEISNGHSVTTRAANADEKIEISSLAQQLLRVDSEFPPPAPPELSTPSYQVKDLTLDGVITLNTGLTIRLDGVHCSPIGFANIRRLATERTVRLAFVSSVGTSSQPIPSEVWLEIYTNQPRDNTLVSQSMVVDTAIVSGWCTPFRTKTTQRYDRYLELEKLFQKNPH